jgi:hypothetical protein
MRTMVVEIGKVDQAEGHDMYIYNTTGKNLIANWNINLQLRLRSG